MESRDRERRVVDVIRNFLLTVRIFRQQQEKYRNSTLSFSDFAKLVDDRGQSALFALKENCHSLFRGNHDPVGEKEQIFDLSIGSLFHLAMKMREDLYQIEFYGPKYLELSGRKDSPSDRTGLVEQFKGVITRAQNSFQEEMNEMTNLLQEIVPQFKGLLTEHRENGLLLRFLVEEKELIREILGEGALENLFSSVYGASQSLPYRIAGESYFQGGFYAEAAKAFSCAAEKNPADPDLLFIYHLSRGLSDFYSLAPQQALKCLEKCLSLSMKKEVLERYRDRISLVCRKIQEEFPGRKTGDLHKDLLKKTRALQRQLEKLYTPRPAPHPAKEKKDPQ